MIARPTTLCNWPCERLGMWAETWLFRQMWGETWLFSRMWAETWLFRQEKLTLLDECRKCNRKMKGGAATRDAR